MSSATRRAAARPSPSRPSAVRGVDAVGRAPEVVRRFGRELRWHRRNVAAVLAVVALLGSAHTLTPHPPTTTPVLVAARPLAAGTTLGPADLRAVSVPSRAAPPTALRTADALLGRRVALPVAAGELLTPDRLVGPGLLTALGPDDVAAPVHLADPDLGGVVRVGDTVRIIAAGEAGAAWVVADDARVLVAPPEGAESAGGPLSAQPATSTTVVVALPASSATALARAAATARLSLVLRAE